MTVSDVSVLKSHLASIVRGRPALKAHTQQDDRTTRRQWKAKAAEWDRPEIITQSILAKTGITTVTLLKLLLPLSEQAVA